MITFAPSEQFFERNLIQNFPMLHYLHNTTRFRVHTITFLLFRETCNFKVTGSRSEIADATQKYFAIFPTFNISGMRQWQSHCCLNMLTKQTNYLSLSNDLVSYIFIHLDIYKLTNLLKPKGSNLELFFVWNRCICILGNDPEHPGLL